MFDQGAAGRLEGLRERLAADLDESELLGRLGAPVDLAGVTAGLHDVAHVDVTALRDDDLLDTIAVLEQARRTLDAACVRVLGELDVRDTTDTRVGLRTGMWLADTAGVASGVGRARVVFARELHRLLPGVVDAFVDGVIGEQHARVLVTAATNQRISDRFVPLVPELVDDATELRFDVWRSKVAALVTLLDQDGPEPDDPTDSNTVSMQRGLGGRWVLRGEFDPVTGAAIHEALSDAADKLFHAANRDEHAAPDLIPPARRNLMARALADMARRTLSAGSTRATAAEIIVHIDAADPSQLRDGQGFPIGNTNRRTLMCDPLLRGVVFGMHRRVLDVARINRLVTDAQRLAMAQRDGGCVFPGCDAPASWTDAHHVEHWEDGGPTDLSNLASLCRHHHGVSHRNGWTMGVTDDEWFWWVTPNGHFLWSQRDGIQRAGPPPPTAFA